MRIGNLSVMVLAIRCEMGAQLSWIFGLGLGLAAVSGCGGAGSETTGFGAEGGGVSSGVEATSSDVGEDQGDEECEFLVQVLH